MNRIIITLMLLTAGFLLAAQTPKPILSFATTLESIPWYKEQKTLWKKEIDKNPSYAFAWYNYYRVTRNLSRIDTTDSRSFKEKMDEMRKIVDDMEKAIPNTFEYNFSKWLIEGNNFNYLNYLQKAEALGEGRTEHLPDLIVYSEVERKLDKRNELCRKWLESKQYSPGLMYYNYNVLCGLKQNAIVLTCGDNDTYPLWLLQSKGIRTDVTVINMSLIRIDSYRSKLFKELGVAQWPASPKDTSDEEKVNKWYENTLIKHLALNTKNYPVYMALTCGESYTLPSEEHLYLTGLAYEYSEKPIDNIALLRKNFEQVYALDYIDKPFFNDISEYYTRLTNMNYVVPMLKLVEHYSNSGDVTRKEEYKRRILNIVKGKKEEAETKKYLDQF